MEGDLDRNVCRDTTSYQCLYDGVVGGVHVGVEGEGAFSITVVGCVAFGSNNPVLHMTSAREVCLVLMFFDVRSTNYR